MKIFWVNRALRFRAGHRARWRAGHGFRLGLGVVLAALAGFKASAQAQSTLLFANQAAGISAAFYAADGVTRLAGDGFLAACYIGTPEMTESQLGPVGQPSTFRVGAGAGFWTPQIFPLPYPGGTVVRIQIRFWDTDGGRFFNFAEAEAGGGAIGVSLSILVRLNIDAVPTTLMGLASASLVPTLTLSRGFPNINSASTAGSPNGSQLATLCGLAVGNNRWFRFSSPQSGLAVLSSEGSAIDTVMSVFTGGIISMSALQPVACNDDREPGNSASQVQFAIEANRLYLACLAGKNGTNGLVQLHSSLATSLEIRDASSYLQLSWPLDATGAVLETSSAPLRADSWQVVPQPPVPTNNCHLLLLEGGQGRSFYRLRLVPPSP